MSELSSVDKAVLAAFREVSSGDQADVPFHEIVVRGESADAVKGSLARLISLKYINSVRFYGRGLKLRELVEAEELEEASRVAELEAAQQTEAGAAG